MFNELDITDFRCPDIDTSQQVDEIRSQIQKMTGNIWSSIYFGLGSNEGPWLYINNKFVCAGNQVKKIVQDKSIERLLNEAGCKYDKSGISRILGQAATGMGQ